jgi:hypothetical protein
MDFPAPTNPAAPETNGAAHAVLAEVTCSWGKARAEHLTAVILHAARDMWILEAADARLSLPPLGTEMRVSGEHQQMTVRLAEHGRGGRFLVSIGDRPVRRVSRMRVSLPGTLRCATLAEPRSVEIVDLTTSGCRVRGIDLPAGSQLALEFTPPGRDESVTVRGLVVHGTARDAQPWIGVLFRLVALRGGR